MRRAAARDPGARPARGPREGRTSRTAIARPTCSPTAAVEEWIEAERIDTPHTHGTGCTLSSAITAYLARGATLSDAVRAGKAFVTEAIRHALPLGDGIGPVDHLWSIPVPGRGER